MPAPTVLGSRVYHSPGFAASVSSTSDPIDFGSQPGRWVAVFCRTANSGVSLSGATVGGVDMDAVGNQSPLMGSAGHGRVFTLVGPTVPTGVATVTVTASDGNSRPQMVVVWGHSADAVSVPAWQEFLSATPSWLVTSDANSVALVLATVDAATTAGAIAGAAPYVTFTPASGVTLAWQPPNPGQSHMVGLSRAGASPTVTVGMTATGSQFTPITGGYRINVTGATAPATGTTFTGPSSGAVGVASSNFTAGVTPPGDSIVGALRVTPSDGGAGGTWTPAFRDLTTAAPTGTFTYTPSSFGPKTLTLANDGGLTVPAALTYTATDTVAPTLSSPTGTATGSTTASGTVSTNEGNGTLHRLASTAATPTVATVKAAGLNQPVSATGSQSVTFTGLAAGTTYYAHYVHTDAAGNDSARASSGPFTTPTGPATAVTLTGPSSGLVGAASAAFTVGANGTITGTVRVTPSAGAGGGSFSPAFVDISAGSPTGTFTYTPVSEGAKSITLTNNGSLTNPAAWQFTASTVTYSATLPGMATDATGSTKRVNAAVRLLAWPWSSIEALASTTPVVVTATTHPSSGDVLISGLPSAGTWAVLGLAPASGATLSGVSFSLVNAA